MVDVIFIKIRGEHHRAISNSGHIALGVSEAGNQEIFGYETRK